MSRERHEVLEALERAVDRLMIEHGAIRWGRSAASTEDDATDLTPEQIAKLGNAVEARRRHFAAGRRSARSALTQLGMFATDIGIGPYGEPLWPKGFEGSISHDGAFAVAVVVEAGRSGVGIDLIERTHFDEAADVLPIIAHPLDDWIRDADPQRRAAYFAAKEAAVKILSPRLSAWIDIECLRVHLHDGQLHVVHEHQDRTVSVRTLELEWGLVSVGMEAGL